MTREEEIRNAIDTIIPIPPHRDGRTYEQALMATGFVAGVSWADNHPANNVWHDASEEPKENSVILVQWNIKGNSGYEFYYADSINWDRFVEIYGVSIWAYISDLLPKQFGNSKQLKGGKQ